MSGDYDAGKPLHSNDDMWSVVPTVADDAAWQEDCR